MRGASEKYAIATSGKVSVVIATAMPSSLERRLGGSSGGMSDRLADSIQ